MNVLAPAPSRWAMAAIAAVPITTLSGSCPTRRTIQRMIGSNSPASFITPKKTTANASSAAVGATLRMPSIANVADLPAKPPAIAATTGTSVRATSTDVTRKRIRPTSVAMVATPRRVSISELRPGRGRGGFLGVLPERRRRLQRQHRRGRQLDGVARHATDAAPAGISISMFRAASCGSAAPRRLCGRGRTARRPR